MMLEHLGFSETAALVESAVIGCVEAEETPVELQGKLGTREVGDAVCRRIRELGG
jgi:isocitrate/isopropylmalate dehydrogenase